MRRRGHARSTSSSARRSHSSSACATRTSTRAAADPRRFRIIDATRPLADVRARAAADRRRAMSWRPRADDPDDDGSPDAAARHRSLRCPGSGATRATCWRGARAGRTRCCHGAGAASASARSRNARAGAAVRIAGAGRHAVRRLPELPLRGRRPASGPAHRRAGRRRRRRGEAGRVDRRRPHSRADALGGTDEPSRRRQGRADRSRPNG